MRTPSPVPGVRHVPDTVRLGPGGYEVVPGYTEIACKGGAVRIHAPRVTAGPLGHRVVSGRTEIVPAGVGGLPRR